MVGLAVAVSPAHAQPPASNPNEMCGDGTTFEVILPHLATGTGGHDTIHVPRGCSIYLVIASDWGRNREFNELLFYPLAKYVAENNGYVHYSWWNNFLKPYMAGPLHSKDNPSDPGPKTTIGMLESVFGLDVIGEAGRDEVYLNDVIRKMKVTKGTIGFWSVLFEQFMLFVQNTVVHVPDDKQFVSDAGQFIKAVRANHEEQENVLVFLAGHGFGGHAIVKVAKDPTNTIDLLAPIDPLGNETLPVGYRQLIEHNANPFVPSLDELSLELGQYGHVDPHSRWRAIFEFKGYQTADCVRGGGLNGDACFDFDPRIFFFNLHCKTPDPNAWQSTTPLVFTWRPFSCPGPAVHPGTRISLGSNVGFLYHRYQKEWAPPIDFGNAYHYGFRSAVTNTLQGPNVQGPIVPGHILFFTSPYYIGGGRTCQSGEPGCKLGDGHDEVVGFRGEPTFNLGAEVILTLTASGVKARDWPSDTVSAANLRSSDTGVNSEQRRQSMIEMASTTINVTDFDCDWEVSIPGGAFWSHSPCTPSDCLVCEDLVTIATNLVAQNSEENSPSDTTAPSMLATVEPEANANGWHRADVVVTLQASDDAAGKGVRDIHYTTPAGTTIQEGNVATTTITAEETTELSFFATDKANNFGTPNLVQVKIDKTLPQIDAVTDPQPNANGWFRTSVTVSFPALDVLSEVASVSPAAQITSEGADQEVEGTATDHADNQASASATLHIDLTPPGIALDSRVPAANAAGWNNSPVTATWNCSDALSGPVAESDSVTVGSEGAAQSAIGTCRDKADHVTTDTLVGINIDTTPPTVAAVSNVAPNGNGWHKTDVVVRFEASDTLSEIAASSPDQTVSTEGRGQSVSGTATNNAGLTASASVVLNIDKTPPQITAAADIAPNSFGWNSGDVRVTFTASDALSELASTTPETLVSSEGAGQEIVGTAKDNADNTKDASVTLYIDKTAPQITATANPAPNSIGWYGGNVVVSFGASDVLSGLAFSSPDVVVSTEGAGQKIAGMAKDKADHTASASLELNIDKTAPGIALSSRTPANGAGWNNTDVTLTWNCSDAVSGPVVAQVFQSLSAEGAAQHATGTCADRAGHTAGNTQSGINIDKTSPTSQITTPANGASYLLNAVVNAGYGCADSLSGVTACVGPVALGAPLDTATVGDKTFTVSAADAAGNQSAVSHVYTVQYAFSGFSNPIAAMPTINTANAGKTIPVKYSLRDVTGAVISDLGSFVSLVSAPVACDTNVPTAEAQETDGAGSTTIHFDSGQFIYNWKTQSAWQGTCRAMQLTLSDGTRHMVTFQFK